MTQRERHASAGLSATVEAPVAITSAAATLLPSRASAAEATHGREAWWEELYHSASPAQQQELLSLAGQQGLLYAHQLPPAPTNGTRPSSDDARTSRLLSQALAGQVEALAAVVVEAVAVHDTALDACQRDAVARALATPDLCLIQGLPGTGKSRVAAEIITQAAARGDRVLLLASGAPALDRVLELVRGRDLLCPIRCLGRDERPEQLSPDARATTLDERVRGLREHTLGKATQARQSAELHCQQRRREEPLWPRLLALAEEYQGLILQGAELAQERGRIPDEVQRQADAATTGAAAPFQTELHDRTRIRNEELARFDGALTETAKQQTLKRQEFDTVTGELTARRPLAEAKQQGRWWSALWWKATFQGNVVERVAELEKQKQTLDAALAKMEQDQQGLQQQRAETEQKFQSERTSIIGAEVARRQGDLDRQQGHLERHQSQLRQHWQTVSVDLVPEWLPAEMSVQAVEASRTRWQAQLQKDETQCQFAAEWATHLEESLETLAQRLPQFANLVAATTAALAASEAFHDASAPAGQFDLLVLEEAEQFTESEFLKAARRARRRCCSANPPRRRPAAAPAMARPAALSSTVSGTTSIAIPATSPITGSANKAACAAGCIQWGRTSGNGWNASPWPTSPKSSCASWPCRACNQSWPRSFFRRRCPHPRPRSLSIENCRNWPCRRTPPACAGAKTPTVTPSV